MNTLGKWNSFSTELHAGKTMQEHSLATQLKFVMTEVILNCYTKINSLVCVETSMHNVACGSRLGCPCSWLVCYTINFPYVLYATKILRQM